MALQRRTLLGAAIALALTPLLSLVGEAAEAPPIYGNPPYTLEELREMSSDTVGDGPYPCIDDDLLSLLGVTYRSYGTADALLDIDRLSGSLPQRITVGTTFEHEGRTWIVTAHLLDSRQEPVHSADLQKEGEAEDLWILTIADARQVIA